MYPDFLCQQRILHKILSCEWKRIFSISLCFTICNCINIQLLYGKDVLLYQPKNRIVKCLACPSYSVRQWNRYGDSNRRLQTNWRMYRSHNKEGNLPTLVGNSHLLILLYSLLGFCFHSCLPPTISTALRGPIPPTFSLYQLLFILIHILTIIQDSTQVSSGPRIQPSVWLHSFSFSLLPHPASHTSFCVDFIIILKFYRPQLSDCKVLEKITRFYSSECFIYTVFGRY